VVRFLDCIFYIVVFLEDVLVEFFGVFSYRMEGILKIIRYDVEGVLKEGWL
jgi:hypothetical protein